MPAKALRFQPNDAFLKKGETIEDCEGDHKVWTKEGPVFKAHKVEIGTSNGIMTEEGFKDYAQLLMDGRKISDSFRFYDDAIAFIVEQRERRLREKMIANYTDADLDSLLSVSLYPYQREGVRFAFTTGKSIIADEMGLGKTIQAIRR